MCDTLRAELNRRCSLEYSAPEYLTLYWVAHQIDVKWESIKKFASGESLTLRGENVNKLSEVLGGHLDIDPKKAVKMPENARRKPKAEETVTKARKPKP